jgi:hypothetical protein
VSSSAFEPEIRNPKEARNSKAENRSVATAEILLRESVCDPRLSSFGLSGHEPEYDDVRGKGFFGQARATSISRSGSVRSEQRSLAEKELPPFGLRRIWPVAVLLVGYRPTAGYAPSSRLATGQIGRNEHHRIYVHDH